MFKLDEDTISSADAERIALLEARVAALEKALAMLGTMEARAALKTQRLTVLPAAQAAAAAPPSAHTPAATRDSLDRLGITSSFDALDSRLAMAAEEESAIPRRTAFETPFVRIDSSLIDRAFERPPPEKLDVISALEEFHPKIAARIAFTWRTPELVSYLRRLIVDERGDRAGFAPGVMSELLMLSAILEAGPEKDAWAANARAV
jgi:hypothetical protein